MSSSSPSFPPTSFVDPTSKKDYSSLKLTQVGPSVVGYNQIYPGYVIQRPFNLTANFRYAEDGNVKNAFLKNDDKPFKNGSDTSTRLELRFDDITDYTKSYTFNMKFYISRSCNNFCLFQIVALDNGVNNGPLFQARIASGNLHAIPLPKTNYQSPLKYDDWNNFSFTLNFNPTASTYSFSFITNSTKKYTSASIPLDNPRNPKISFKCGVYNLDQYGPPPINEVFLKDIFIYNSV